MPNGDRETLRSLLRGRGIPARVRVRGEGYTVTVDGAALERARMLIDAWGFARDTDVSPAELGAYRGEAVAFD